MSSIEKTVIEEFLKDINFLSQINKHISGFNTFETLGIVNNEIRHSNVLSWLLKPNENHGLSDFFISELTRYIYEDYEYEQLSDCNIDTIEMLLMDLKDTRVYREWRNIDILCVSEKNKLLIAIENKVLSNESDGQLKKYYNILKNEYSDYNKIYLLLTPDNREATDSDIWLSIGYDLIISILDKSLSKMNRDADSFGFIEQYKDILRRYVVGDTELEKICHEIYRKHKKALDIIYEYKPDIVSDIGKYIYNILHKDARIVIEKTSKSRIYFTTKEIDKVIPKLGEGWLEGKRIFMFETQKYDSIIEQRIYIGPGDQELRNKLFGLVKKYPKTFSSSKKSPTTKWTFIYKKTVLSKNYQEKYEDDPEKMYKMIDRFYDKFLGEDLERIESAIVEYMTSS